MIGFLRQTARAILRLFGRYVATPIVMVAGQRPEGSEIPVSVHILVSSKTWRMGILSVLSLEYFSGRRWTLFVHEDGSINDRIRDRILAKLPGVRFVSRKEADDSAKNYLSGFPVCARNRGKHNLFLKFFDPPSFSPYDKYLILDSDLFFFRRPQELLDWALGSERSCHYNLDPTEVYCLSRERIEAELGVRLWDRFNSGLVCVCREAIDLTLSERLLAAFENKAPHPQFFEQTLYALNASAFGRGGPLPQQYEITWNIFRRRDSICRHYVGGAKWDHLYFEGPTSLLFLMALPLMGRRILRAVGFR